MTEASTKVQLLTNLAGLGVRRIVKGLSLPTPSGSDTEYTVLRQGLESYFRPAVNTTVERHKFRMRKQQPAESLTWFAAGLRTAAEACEFDSTTNDSIVDSQIRDQFIAGLANIEIRRELLADPNLTLATAIRKGVSMELSYSESKLYDQPGKFGFRPTEDSIPSGASANRVSTHSRSSPVNCKYCGEQHTPGMAHCPAAGKKCNNCGKRGHFSKVCLSRRGRRQDGSRPGQANACKEEESAKMCATDDLIYLTKPLSKSSHDERFLITLSVNGKPVSGLLDTGAKRTICPADVVKPDSACDRRLCAYDGSEVPTLEMADITVAGNSRQTACRCFVVPEGKRHQQQQIPPRSG